VAAMRRPFSVVFLRFVPDVGDVMMSDRSASADWV
jgi:hypothetical protein